MRHCLPKKVLNIAAAAVAVFISYAGIASARAGSVTFVTPPGSSTSGGPVNATATFLVGPGSIKITLTNLQANPTDVAQLLSGLSFTTNGGVSLNGTSETAATGQEISVASNGTETLGALLTTPSAEGWIYSGSGTSGSLNDLAAGGAGPHHLIIGPPGPGGIDSNGNGSIDGNKPHNPFINQTATFTITGLNITADTIITGATFSFGTSAGINVVGQQSVPEPSSVVMGLVGLGLVGAAGLYRRRRAA